MNIQTTANDMSGFKFLHYERIGDLLRIAINRPPFSVLDIATMAEKKRVILTPEF